MKNRVGTRAGLLGVVLGVVLAGCTADGEEISAVDLSPAPTAADTFVLRGTVTITEPEAIVGAADQADQESCSGAGPAFGVAAGTRVTVADADGTEVGRSALNPGTGQLVEVADGTSRWTSCTFAFIAPRVTLGPDFYDITVSLEDPMRVSAAEAQAGELQLTLPLV